MHRTILELIGAFLNSSKIIMIEQFSRSYIKDCTVLQKLVEQCGSGVTSGLYTTFINLCWMKLKKIRFVPNHFTHTNKYYTYRVLIEYQIYGYRDMCCCSVCERPGCPWKMCVSIYYCYSVSCQYWIVRLCTNYDHCCGVKERTGEEGGWRGGEREKRKERRWRRTERTIRTHGGLDAKREGRRGGG